MLAINFKNLRNAQTNKIKDLSTKLDFYDVAQKMYNQDHNNQLHHQTQESKKKVK